MSLAWAQALVERTDAARSFGNAECAALYRRHGKKGHALRFEVELGDLGDAVDRWAGTDEERQAACEVAARLGGWEGLCTLVGWKGPGT